MANADINKSRVCPQLYPAPNWRQLATLLQVPACTASLKAVTTWAPYNTLCQEEKFGMASAKFPARLGSHPSPLPCSMSSTRHVVWTEPLPRPTPAAPQLSIPLQTRHNHQLVQGSQGAQGNLLPMLCIPAHFPTRQLL